MFWTDSDVNFSELLYGFYTLLLVTKSSERVVIYFKLWWSGWKFYRWLIKGNLFLKKKGNILIHDTAAGNIFKMKTWMKQVLKSSYYAFEKDPNFPPNCSCSLCFLKEYQTGNKQIHNFQNRGKCVLDFSSQENYTMEKP